MAGMCTSISAPKNVSFRTVVDGCDGLYHSGRANFIKSTQNFPFVTLIDSFGACRKDQGAVGKRRGGAVQKRGSASSGRRGDRGKAAVRKGRGRGQGKGEKKKSKEELDAEMDAYFLKDEKTAAQRLNADLDDYWKAKPTAEAEAEADAEAGAGVEAEAGAEGAEGAEAVAE